MLCHGSVQEVEGSEVVCRDLGERGGVRKPTLLPWLEE